MMNVTVLSTAIILVGPLAWGQISSDAASTPTTQQALINKYCVGCHNDKLTSGGLSLAKLGSTLTAGRVSDNPEE